MADELIDITKRLEGWFTNWNGARMAPGEPPRDGIHCDVLMDAKTEIERLRADNNSAHASITLLTGTVEALRRDIERLKSEIVSARETMCNVADEAKVQYRRLLRCLPDTDAGLPTAADVRGILKDEKDAASG